MATGPCPPQQGNQSAGAPSPQVTRGSGRAGHSSQALPRFTSAHTGAGAKAVPTVLAVTVTGAPTVTNARGKLPGKNKLALKTPGPPRGVPLKYHREAPTPLPSRDAGAFQWAGRVSDSRLERVARQKQTHKFLTLTTRLLTYFFKKPLPVLRSRPAGFPTGGK